MYCFKQSGLVANIISLSDHHSHLLVISVVLGRMHSARQRAMGLTNSHFIIAVLREEKRTQLCCCCRWCCSSSFWTFGSCPWVAVLRCTWLTESGKGTLLHLLKAIHVKDRKKARQVTTCCGMLGYPRPSFAFCAVHQRIHRSTRKPPLILLNGMQKMQSK